MKTTAQHFKELRDLFTLYEGSDYHGKATYSALIILKIEEIKLDGANEHVTEFFEKRGIKEPNQ